MAAALYDLILETLAYGGEALGRLEDGRAVFVPFGLPGERVRLRLTEEKRGHARGELVQVLQAASERIAPRCKHFGTCGGCHYQHMQYQRQLDAKAAILRDQLSRIGRIENAPVRPTIPSPDEWNYRNQIQFQLTTEGKLGYVRASDGGGRARGVLAIEECHLPQAAINALWPQLEFESRSGVQRVSIRAGKADDLLLVLEGDSPDVPELEIDAGISVVHAYAENSVTLAGDPYVTLHALGRDFRVSAVSFFQVNTAVAELMIQHVLELVPASTGTILDAYCGVGLFSAFLAPKCGRLIAIESSPAACEDFAVNLDEFDNVELYEAPAEQALAALEIRPDVAVVDPPRAGLAIHALEALMRTEADRILYVSCDPSTLARDASRMIQAGYRLMQVTPFDLFPQTYHIESISTFER